MNQTGGNKCATTHIHTAPDCIHGVHNTFCKLKETVVWEFLKFTFCLTFLAFEFKWSIRAWRVANDSRILGFSSFNKTNTLEAFCHVEMSKEKLPLLWKDRLLFLQKRKRGIFFFFVFSTIRLVWWSLSGNENLVSLCVPDLCSLYHTKMPQNTLNWVAFWPYPDFILPPKASIS